MHVLLVLADDHLLFIMYKICSLILHLYSLSIEYIGILETVPVEVDFVAFNIAFFAI